MRTDTNPRHLQSADFADFARRFFPVLGLFYMALVMLLFVFYGRKICLSVITCEERMQWYQYELLFGMGSCAMIVFFSQASGHRTGAPCMFGTRRLILLSGLWLLGRFNHLTLNLWGIWSTALLDLTFSAVALSGSLHFLLSDKRKASIGYTLLFIFAIQIYYFGCSVRLFAGSSHAALDLALGAVILLAILVLKRIYILNVTRGQNVASCVPLPRYHLASFCIALFTAVEFCGYSPSLSGWLGLATMAAVLGVLSDLRIRDLYPRITMLYFLAVFVLAASGYGMLGYGYLHKDFAANYYSRYLLLTGVLSLSFYMLLTSAADIGRNQDGHYLLVVGAVLLVAAALMQASIAFLPRYKAQLELGAGLSAIIAWILPVIRFGCFYPSDSQS